MNRFQVLLSNSSFAFKFKLRRFTKHIAALLSAITGGREIPKVGWCRLNLPNLC